MEKGPGKRESERAKVYKEDGPDSGCRSSFFQIYECSPVVLNYYKGDLDIPSFREASKYFSTL